jgi:hypothetical protein
MCARCFIVGNGKGVIADGDADNVVQDTRETLFRWKWCADATAMKLWVRFTYVRTSAEMPRRACCELRRRGEEWIGGWPSEDSSCLRSRVICCCMVLNNTVLNKKKSNDKL